MPETICLAGLYHSVYGTEGFQGYTLPLAERPKIRELIGARGELAVFYNCVMDKSSCDRLTVAALQSMPAAGSDGSPGAVVPGTLQSRPGIPGLAPQGEDFVLTRRQLEDLCIVNYADDFDQVEYKLETPGTDLYCRDRVPGKWIYGVGGMASVRLEFKVAAAKFCGGALAEAHAQMQALVPPGTPLAVWAPTGEERPDQSLRPAAAAATAKM